MPLCMQNRIELTDWILTVEIQFLKTAEISSSSEPTAEEELTRPISLEAHQSN